MIRFTSKGIRSGLAESISAATPAAFDPANEFPLGPSISASPAAPFQSTFQFRAGNPSAVAHPETRRWVL